jgi:hypothetical protein
MIALKQLKSKLLDPYVSALSKKKKSVTENSLNDLIITRHNGDTYLVLLATEGKTLYSYLTVNVGNRLGFDPNGVAAIPMDTIISDTLISNNIYTVPDTDNIDMIVFARAKESFLVPFSDNHKLLIKNAHKFIGTEPSRKRLTWLNFNKNDNIACATDGYTALGTYVDPLASIVTKTNTFAVQSSILPILSKMSDVWFEMNFKLLDSGKSWVEISGVDTSGFLITLGIVNASENSETGFEDAPDISNVIPKGELLCDSIPYNILDDILRKDFINDQFGKDVLKGAKTSEILVRFFAFDESDELAVQFINLNEARNESSSVTVLPLHVVEKSLDVYYTLEYIGKAVLEGIDGFETQMLLTTPRPNSTYGKSMPALFHYAENGTSFGIVMNRKFDP